VSALIARLTQAFRALPTTGTAVAVVLSAALAVGIAGPLVYRAIDDGGGGGGDTTTAAEPDTGGGQNGNGNGDNGTGPLDGDNGTDVPIPPGGIPGGGSAGSATGVGGSGTPTAPPGGSPGGDVPPPETGPGGPTVPPPTTTPPTTDPPVEPDPVLLVAKEPNRTGAVPLDGAVLTGSVFPFVADGNAATERVDFFWDDPEMKGAPVSSDLDPDFDFCGTDGAGLAIPFNSVFAPNGSHVMTVKVTGLEGTTVVRSAKLEIRNIIPDVLPPLCGLPPRE
jgi:hypothetical protein